MCGKRGKTESSVERQTRDEGEEAVIIGGMVLDIHGTPSGPANPRTTTPGKVISLPTISLIYDID